jgi:glycosyltransferase involved in cell wall biosynthesis
MKLKILIFALSILITPTHSWSNKKIVGLVPVRNESLYIEQCLLALAQLTDAIVVLDDASQDNTVEIVKSLQQQCRIERIVEKKIWYRDEPGDRNTLLKLGREIGGTHFVVLDADEMFTANMVTNNKLRQLILSLQPGNHLEFHWIRLWKSLQQYRADGELKNFVFCDDGTCFYESGFIHTSRVPHNLKNQSKISVTPYHTYGVLHFQAVNWRNMQIRRAWYHCILRMRRPDFSDNSINEMCQNQDSKNEAQVRPCLAEWFDYPFFSATAFEKPDIWREKQVVEWINEHGKNYFKNLNIWDVDWGAYQ